MPGIDNLDPQRVAFFLVTIVIAIAVHEFMHAWTASMLGDDTARLLGRVSLNPIVHFDPVGGLMTVLMALGISPFAWGRPVPVNDYRLRSLGRFGRHGSMALVALAGPLSNVCLGAIAATVLRVSALNGVGLGESAEFWAIFMTVNFSLAAFNMIPLPPLDGSRILNAVLPAFWRPILEQIGRYGLPALFLLILVGGSYTASIIYAIAGPVYNLLLQVFAPSFG